MKLSRRQLRLLIEQAAEKTTKPSASSAKGAAGMTKGNAKAIKAYKMLEDVGRAFGDIEDKGGMMSKLSEICYALAELPEEDEIVQELEGISNKLAQLTPDD
tara:strand:- start:331 stop:636 length:306 start_codon:yes stop_codon:yes gene_type:complete